MHVAIVRTGSSVLNLKTYNCQELGLAKALTKNGLKVSLILASHESHTETIDGVDVYYCTFKSLNQQLSFSRDIIKVLDKITPDIVQVHDMGVFMTWRVVLWANNHKVPSFLIQGNYQTTRKPFFRQLEHIYNLTFGKYVLRNVSGIGCKTLSASRYLQRYYNRETSLTYVGLDTSAFARPKEKNWRSELNIDEKKVLLYVGVQEERRNPMFLVEILKCLPPEYVLIMAGDGPSFTAVNKRINSEGLSGRVFLLGKCSQELLPSLYRIADAFLLASNYEIYGMVILEAMYFGVPVISTVTAGSETLIESGKDGYLMYDMNPDKWAETIESLCENKVQHNAMKKAAFEKIKNYFIWDEAVNQYKIMYGIV